MNYIKKELWFTHKDEKIYGYCLIPENKNVKNPTILFAHGYNGSYKDNLTCAIICAEKGFASVSIDFPGGCLESKSGGDMRKTSVKIELEELLDVFQQVKKLDFVDESAVYLYGESQGGYVAALAAAQLKQQIKALILIYPAFALYDFVHQMFKEKSLIPETAEFLDCTIGKCYSEDIWDQDPYSMIGEYEGKVLIIHGTEDTLVPRSYSDRAEEIYQDAEYYLIEGANHGFHGCQLAQANEVVLHYLLKCEKNTLAVQKIRF